MQHDDRQADEPSPEDLALDETSSKYLLFDVGGEAYGARLDSVREVVRAASVKAVPYMVPHFKGVFNLRGQLVSVIDLRIKFGIRQPQASDLMLVCETAAGRIGVVVDDVTSVATLLEADIERNTAIATKVPVTFFQGIAKIGERLVNLIDVAGCLSTEEYALVARTKEAV
jgi:purine-binding chemotaxis protein CheW